MTPHSIWHVFKKEKGIINDAVDYEENENPGEEGGGNGGFKKRELVGRLQTKKNCNAMLWKINYGCANFLSRKQKLRKIDIRKFERNLNFIQINN